MSVRLLLNNIFDLQSSSSAGRAYLNILHITVGLLISLHLLRYNTATIQLPHQ